MNLGSHGNLFNKAVIRYRSMNGMGNLRYLELSAYLALHGFREFEKLLNLDGEKFDLHLSRESISSQNREKAKILIKMQGMFYSIVAKSCLAPYLDLLIYGFIDISQLENINEELLFQPAFSVLSFYVEEQIIGKLKHDCLVRRKCNIRESENTHSTYSYTFPEWNKMIEAQMMMLVPRLMKNSTFGNEPMPSDILSNIIDLSH
jgi:hypothetical protein